jgi:hypothetical protein
MQMNSRAAMAIVCTISATIGRSSTRRYIAGEAEGEAESGGANLEMSGSHL